MLEIEYDRLDQNRWQRQKDRPNIQGLIENAIKEITKEDKIELIGSGRTDSNVHAISQIANFYTDSKMEAEKFIPAINSKLRKSIRIKDAKEVNLEFNSRFNAKKKTYKYIINNSDKESAIYRNLEYFYPLKLDENNINSALLYLIGEHDFSSFKSSGGSTKTTIRTIYSAKCTRIGDRIEISLCGNGFLYNMVRIIVGTLIDVGTGKITPEEFKEILDKKDRKYAGKTAPAHGLYLESVNY